MGRGAWSRLLFAICGSCAITTILIYLPSSDNERIGTVCLCKAFSKRSFFFVQDVPTVGIDHVRLMPNQTAPLEIHHRAESWRRGALVTPMMDQHLGRSATQAHTTILSASSRCVLLYIFHINSFGTELRVHTISTAQHRVGVAHLCRTRQLSTTTRRSIRMHVQ